MPNKIPDEVVVARLSIEAARVALESLFERMSVTPRSEKIIINETVHEACARLKSAQDLLLLLERQATGSSADLLNSEDPSSEDPSSDDPGPDDPKRPR
jgi:hypothetical protein